MRVRTYKLDNGRVRLEIGYYREMYLEDIRELVQLSSDLNYQIGQLLNPTRNNEKNMKPHGIFTLMLRKRLVSKEEMAFIMAIAEEIRRMTGRDGCYDNDMGHVLDGNHDVTVTIDGKSLMPGDRQHEITRITGTIRKLMNKELPLAENERSRDVIIKEMTLHYPSEKLELVVNSAFLPTFGMDACNALPASTGHPGRTQTMA